MRATLWWGVRLLALSTILLGGWSMDATAEESSCRWCVPCGLGKFGCCTSDPPPGPCDEVGPSREDCVGDEGGCWMGEACTV